MTSHLPSAGRRFVRALGFSLMQAAVFGTLVGAWVRFHPPRASLEAASEGTLTLAQRLLWPLEALELATYDWRARQAGRKASPPESVALVTLDEETLASAREDEHPEVATQPWPRELVGRMVRELDGEGASLTLVDLAFPDLSPRGSVAGSDDERFRRLLDQGDAPAVLTFDVLPQAPPPTLHPLRPYLVLLGAPASPEERLDLLGRVLAERRPAYAIPSGSLTGVWAGVLDQGEGQGVSKRWQLSGEPRIREFAAQDRAYQVDAVALAVMLSELKVRGLEPERLPQVRWLRPPAAPLLGRLSPMGFKQLWPDRDGVVRGVQLLVNYVGPDGQSHVLPSAPLAAALRIKGGRPPLRYEHGRLWLSDRDSIPMDDTGYSLLFWQAGDTDVYGRGTLPRAVSAWRIVRNVLDERAGVPPHYRNDVARRAVVLTDTAARTAWTDVPVGPSVSPGAVLGQALANLVGNEGIVHADPRLDLTATFALAFAGAFLALTFSGFFQSLLGAAAYFASLLAAGGAYLGFARHLFISRHEWVAVAGPLVALVATFTATTLYALQTQRQMREFVEAALGRYVSPEITRQVFRNVALMRPEKRLVSLCLSDLEGFTGLLERLAPARLVELLNEYFTEMTAVVRQSGGQVEYAGDAVLAFFGAPVRTERHALLACQSALAMRASVERRRADWEKRYGQKVDFRTGIFTGEVLVGDVGSRLKSNYTVLGEPVVLAERLESANRAYGTSILAGEGTERLARGEFVFREVDQVAIRGGAARLYELVGRRGEVPKPRLQDIAAFETALSTYRTRRFTEALEAFTALASRDPVARVYVERCQGFIAAPPPEAWTGVGDLRRQEGA